MSVWFMTDHFLLFSLRASIWLEVLLYYKYLVTLDELSFHMDDMLAHVSSM